MKETPKMTGNIASGFLNCVSKQTTISLIKKIHRSTLSCPTAIGIDCPELPDLKAS